MTPSQLKSTTENETIDSYQHYRWLRRCVPAVLQVTASKVKRLQLYLYSSMQIHGEYVRKFKAKSFK